MMENLKKKKLFSNIQVLRSRCYILPKFTCLKASLFFFSKCINNLAQLQQKKHENIFTEKIKQINYTQ